MFEESKPKALLSSLWKVDFFFPQTNKQYESSAKTNDAKLAAD